MTSTLECCALLSELIGKPFVRDRVCCGVYFATGNHADKGHDGREAWSRVFAACTNFNNNTKLAKGGALTQIYKS